LKLQLQEASGKLSSENRNATSTLAQFELERERYTSQLSELSAQVDVLSKENKRLVAQAVKAKEQERKLQEELR